MWVTIVTNEGYKGVKSRLHVKENNRESEKKKGYNPNFKYYSPSNTIAKNLSYTMKPAETIYIRRSACFQARQLSRYISEVY
jgi:hypothetical protein